MARGPFSTSDYFARTSAVVTAAPLTFACWFKLNSFVANGTLISVGVSGADANRFSLWTRLTGTTLSWLAIEGATSNRVEGTVAITAGPWFHAAGVAYAANSRAIFTNGGDKRTSAVAINPTGLNNTRIGIRHDSSNPTVGVIADAAIWNVALTDQEIAALGAGCPPRLMRPGNQVGYWPLWGDDSPEPDWSGNGNSLTMTGTVAKGSHAPTALWMPTTLRTAYPISATLLAALPPDAVLASTNLDVSGGISVIQDDPLNPGDTWFGATSATAATDLRVSFGTPGS